jgi:hypothetical protein
MRADVTQVLQRLWASHRPEFQGLMSAAHLDDPVPPSPHPDAVEPYRWLLQRLGDGLKLTAAGWLPPAVVVETMQRFGWDAEWIGKGNREDLTPPVAELRVTARLLGLVRVYRGELKCTDAGRRLRDDPVALWWHVAAHLPLGRSEPERQAGLLWLLTVAASAARPDQLVADGMWLLGWAQGGRVARSTGTRRWAPGATLRWSSAGWVCPAAGASWRTCRRRPPSTSLAPRCAPTTRHQQRRGARPSPSPPWNWRSRSAMSSRGSGAGSSSPRR